MGLRAYNALLCRIPLRLDSTFASHRMEYRMRLAIKGKQ